MSVELLEFERVDSILAGFYGVYNYFDYGLTEPIYIGPLEVELSERGHKVTRELRVPVTYKGRRVAWQRLDMVVDGKIIVESKATEKLAPAARIQIVSYLRASAFPVGLLLHFGPKPSFQKFIDWPKRQRDSKSSPVPP